MDYNTFLTTITQSLQQKLGSNYVLAIHPVPKNNGVILDGLTVQSPTSHLTPTIYLNPYYEQFQDGLTSDEIISDILDLLLANPLCSSLNETDLTDFSQMKPRIMMRLIHADSNIKLLSEIPYIPCLDLAVIFYLFLDRNAAGQMTTLIHNEYLEYWQISKKELFRLALSNTPKAFPPKITDIADVMKDIARHNLGDAYNEKALDELLQEETNISPLYVLSNQSAIYGACCILYQNLLKNFADCLEKDLIILPSSIHEVLLAPYEKEISYQDLNSLVDNINRCEVPTEDQLSNHVYLYLRETDQIIIPSDDYQPV